MARQTLAKIIHNFYRYVDVHVYNYVHYQIYIVFWYIFNYPG